MVSCKIMPCETCMKSQKENFSLRIDAGMRQQIEHAAKCAQISEADVIRRCVAFSIDRLAAMYEKNAEEFDMLRKARK